METVRVDRLRRPGGGHRAHLSCGFGGPGAAAACEVFFKLLPFLIQMTCGCLDSEMSRRAFSNTRHRRL